MAILTLALGIGVTAAIFSVLWAVLLRPLPYEKSKQLTLIWSEFHTTGALRAPMSGVMLGEIQRRSRSFQEIGGIWAGRGTFVSRGNPEQIKIGFITTNFLHVLGVKPMLGRLFVPEERAGGRSAMVLSYGLWRHRFAGDASIVGKPVTFEGESVTIVGVLGPDFHLYFAPTSNVPPDVEAFIPFQYDIYKAPRTLYYLRVLARLRGGVTPAAAQAELQSVAGDLRRLYSEFNVEKVDLDLVGLHEDAVRQARPAILALFAGAAFVLTICFVNVANLLLARASDRRKEMALRRTLGASEGRIVWQLMAEASVLCAAAAVGGIACAWAGVHILLRLSPADVVRFQEPGLSWAMVAFVAVVSFACVFLIGLAPGLAMRSLDLNSSLSKGGRGSRTPAGRSVRAALIVSEVTLGFVLVSSAGLMIRTAANVGRVRPGFEPLKLLTFEIELPGGAYGQAKRLAFVKTWETKLRGMPGVESEGAISHLPFDDYPNWYSSYRPEGVPAAQAAGRLADYRCVTPGYFRAMQTRLIAGRLLDEHDNASAKQVIVVDSLLAKEAWPGENAIGKRVEGEHFQKGDFVPVTAEVVGVVEHVRVHSLADDARPQVYIPYEQSPREHLTFVVRTRVEPLSLAPTVRQELASLDPELAISKMRPMTAYVEQARTGTNFTASLAAVFGAMGLLLASIGIYGVIYYTVSRRMQEMGVRMALGAQTGDVMRLVLREGLSLTGIGVVLGIAGALAASEVLRSLVYGVSPTDAATYAVAAVVLAASAMLACWRPARKAASANPVDALRAE